MLLFAVFSVSMVAGFGVVVSMLVDALFSGSCEAFLAGGADGVAVALVFLVGG